MIGWLGDFFRFWWALLYWNVRKSVFRLRRRREACPCQSPSDSGRALETRCEACATWDRPARFRHVCPHLVSTPGGLRCAVDAAEVRPAWGRAAAILGVSVLGLYLAGTLAFFGLARGIGYRVGYGAVLSPSRWSELTGAQEQNYARQAQVALAVGNYQGAILALNRVCELNPRNYTAALALANLWHLSGQSALSDRTYERLMQQHPEQRAQTGKFWYQALLSRGAFSQIKDLASRMLADDPANRSAWLHALFFAHRQAPDPAQLAALPGRIPALPEWCRHLLTIELALEQNRTSEALATLLHPEPLAASSYVAIYHVDRLTYLGRYDDAAALIEKSSKLISPDEAAFLRMAIYSRRGWRALVESEFDSALQQLPLNARTIPQFCAFLIRHPNPILLARFHDRFMQVVPSPTADLYPSLNALFCACAVNADWPRVQTTSGVIKRVTASDARTLAALETFFRNDYQTKRIDLFLVALALPTDAVYALHERFGRASRP